jgi:cytidine deaminase
MTDRELLDLAIEARKYSYAPYSEFHVGAALLTKSGKVYKGCNIENASFGATNCAERTAIFKAVSEGEGDFEAIAIVGGKDGKELELCPPCGICRQVMTEFCDLDTFRIVLGDEHEERSYTLTELLPLTFEGMSK